MLTVLRDDRGHLLAACDWWLVNALGQYDVQGDWVFVEQLELNPHVDSRYLIHDVIQDIAHRVPWAVGAYWERRDKQRGDYRSYFRSQLLREEVRT